MPTRAGKDPEWSLAKRLSETGQGPQECQGACGEHVRETCCQTRLSCKNREWPCLQVCSVAPQWGVVTCHPLPMAVSVASNPVLLIAVGSVNTGQLGASLGKASRRGHANALIKYLLYVSLALPAGAVTIPASLRTRRGQGEAWSGQRRVVARLLYSGVFGPPTEER